MAPFNNTHTAATHYDEDDLVVDSNKEEEECGYLFTIGLETSTQRRSLSPACCIFDLLPYKDMERQHKNNLLHNLSATPPSSLSMKRQYMRNCMTLQDPERRKPVFENDDGRVKHWRATTGSSAPAVRAQTHLFAKDAHMLLAITQKWTKQASFLRYMDGNKSNNSVYNIELVSHFDAMKHPNYEVDWILQLTAAEYDFVLANKHYFVSLWGPFTQFKE